MKLKESFTSQDLADYGCYVFNCKFMYWEASNQNILDFLPNASYIQFSFQRGIPVTTIKQSLAYTWNNFIADFGGYLGLLLGASLLSIYDSGTAIIEKYIRKIIGYRKEPCPIKGSYVI